MEAHLFDQFEEVLGKEKISKSESELYRHSRDESSHPFVEPDFVLFPDSVEDIVTVLKIANEHKVPVTPYGAGSGLEGQAIPIHKGISISFDNMKK